MATLFNNVANTLTTNFVPVQATFDTSGGFLTFIGPGGVPFTAGSSLSINSTSIIGGTSGSVLYDNAGTIGEKAVTGTGSVVLNNSPIFATDITVNGMYVGKGYWQDATSSAFGFAALESPYGTPSNASMTGIGYNTLSSFGVGIATVTIANGGSGYYDNTGLTDTFSFSATLTYVSGPTSLGTYPTATIDVVTGVVTNVTITNVGYGFPNTGVTVMTATNPLGPGSGLLLNRNAFKFAANNTAIGYFSGSTNTTGSNSLYLGYNALGTGSNEIVIGANATGAGDNTVVIGDASITDTTLKGTVNIAGILSATGGLNLTGTNNIASSFHTNQTTGSLTIGGASATGATNIGRSTVTHTFNIDNGTLAALAIRTINMGVSGAANSITLSTIGTTGVQGTNRSYTLFNGTIRLQTFTVSGLPTGVAGARSFVTDALAPVFGNAVAGSGAVRVPVYHDGTTWRVG